MDDHPSGNPTPLFPSHTGTRYDASTRDLAYQLWAFTHGRNASSVAVAMQREHPNLDERTVQRWAKDGAWAGRVRADVRALAPAIHEAIVVDLIAGAQEAAAYVRAVVRGDDPSVVHQTRVTAALGLLDRAGFAVRKDAGPLAPAPPAPAVEAIPESTDTADIVRRMERLIQDSRT